MKMTVIFLTFIYSLSLYANTEIIELIKTTSFKNEVSKNIEKIVNSEEFSGAIMVTKIDQLSLVGTQNDPAGDVFTFTLSILAQGIKYKNEVPTGTNYDMNCELIYYFNNPSWEFDGGDCKIIKF